MTKFACLVAALVLVSLAACAGPVGIQTDAGDGSSSAPGLQLPEDFPALPARDASAAFTAELNGAESLMQSANSMNDGTTVQLVSGSNSISWAVWKFSPGMASLDSIEVVLSVPDGQQAYIGLAEYSRNSWRFGQPVTAGQVLSLSDVKHKSAGGVFAAAVATTGGDMATVYKLILRTESEWSIVTVDDGDGNGAGIYTSLVPVNDRPGLCYGTADRRLNYVWGDDAPGTSWGETETIADGVASMYISLASQFQGEPAACWFYDTGPGMLMFSYAHGIAGSWWDTPKQIDSAYPVGENTGEYCSLAFNVENPAISYYSEDKNALMYVTGIMDWNSWGEPKLVASGHYTWTSLVYDPDHRPLIVFRDETEKNLMLVGRNPSNTDWNPPQLVDGEGDVGSHSDARIVSGNVAISYYDATNGDLKYAYYDVQHSQWEYRVVDASGDVGRYTSLAIIEGNPAIAYYDAANGDLKYVRAADARGAAWGSPVVVDRIGDTGLYGSLAEVAGRAAISYHDATRGLLKYAYHHGP